ncbi:expressed unknown protein [Ectocarpus siliculosus]|uniref:Uncharacterized protein n=1 Tax=Ectocarpus siliculosus TaxID=2880 RepID=D7G194_ECTSI|nr:expressed unknown protein [Ectocarpus siliculosus]|eukprot:CBJ33204.1 expressed unknown protein [Ectocarpus siliculosus]
MWGTNVQAQGRQQCWTSPRSSLRSGVGSLPRRSSGAG